MSDETSPLLSTTKLNKDDIEGCKECAATAFYSRWQAFTGVLFYVSIVGTTYAFGVYSQLLKQNLGFSQNDIDIVASVGNTGLYLSVVAGIALQTTESVKFVVRGGGFLIFIGFLYIFLAVQLLVPANVLSICVFFFLSQFGVCCHISSAVTIGVQLFPPVSRGAAVGLAKGYFGLSSAVLGDFAGGFFANAAVYFILFISLAIPTASLIGSEVVNLIPASMVPFDYETAKGISISMTPFFVHWGSLFSFILALGYVEFAFDTTQTLKIAASTLLVVMVVCINVIPDLYGPRVVVDEMSTFDPSALQLATHTSSSSGARPGGPEVADDEHAEKTLSTELGTTTSSTPLIQDVDVPIKVSPPHSVDSDSHTSIVVKTECEPQTPECFYGDSIPLTQSLFLWRYWSLYFVFFTITGTGLMVIDNINAIAEALGTHPSSFFVTLVSLANGLGRVVAGFASDKLLPYVSKLQLLALNTLLMCVAQLLFAAGSVSLLYPCLLLVGLLFGASVSLMAVNVADLCGSKFIATNFGMIDSAPIFGSYIFVTGIVALFYRDNTQDDAGNWSCVGVDCFRSSFMINSTCCFFAAMLCYCMHVHTPIPVARAGVVRGH